MQGLFLGLHDPFVSIEEVLRGIHCRIAFRRSIPLEVTEQVITGLPSSSVAACSSVRVEAVWMVTDETILSIHIGIEWK